MAFQDRQRLLRVPCPECGGANRHGKRRCKATGGECGGAGWAFISVADNEFASHIQNENGVITPIVEAS